MMLPRKENMVTEDCTFFCSDERMPDVMSFMANATDTCGSQMCFQSQFKKNICSILVDMDAKTIMPAEKIENPLEIPGLSKTHCTEIGEVILKAAMEILDIDARDSNIAVVVETAPFAKIKRDEIVCIKSICTENLEKSVFCVASDQDQVEVKLSCWAKIITVDSFISNLQSHVEAFNRNGGKTPPASKLCVHEKLCFTHEDRAQFLYQLQQNMNQVQQEKASDQNSVFFSNGLIVEEGIDVPNGKRWTLNSKPRKCAFCNVNEEMASTLMAEHGKTAADWAGCKGAYKFCTCHGKVLDPRTANSVTAIALHPDCCKKMRSATEEIMGYCESNKPHAAILMTALMTSWVPSTARVTSRVKQQISMISKKFKVTSKSESFRGAELLLENNRDLFALLKVILRSEPAFRVLNPHTRKEEWSAHNFKIFYVMSHDGCGARTGLMLQHENPTDFYFRTCAFKTEYAKGLGKPNPNPLRQNINGEFLGTSEDLKNKISHSSEGNLNYLLLTKTKHGYELSRRCFSPQCKGCKAVNFVFKDPTAVGKIENALSMRKPPARARRKVERKTTGVGASIKSIQ